MTDIDITAAIEAAKDTLLESPALGCGCCAWPDDLYESREEQAATEAITAALPHIIAQVEAHVKPSREDVAKIVAEAALDWVDVGSEMHWHTLDCTNWTAYADEADLILALFPGRTEQEVREEIAGISEETAMGLWREACDNGWEVPDDLPSKYLKHVVREMNQRIARGGEGR